MSAAHSAPEIRVCTDRDALAAEAAERLVLAANEAVQARGRFTLALSGGSTPEALYALLTRPEWQSRLDWSRAFLFFGDERFVPPDDPRSNYHMARAALLERLAPPPAHIFRVPTDAKDPAASAAAYARTLADAFGVAPDGPPPRFDLILLGMGDDGHTASLFPGAAALNESKAWVTWEPPGVLPPPVDRVTLTYTVLNAAREVLFLVAGANKAEALREVLEGNASPERRPSAGVRPSDGKLTWLVDEAAAGRR